jgi:hypothetical protein
MGHFCHFAFYPPAHQQQEQGVTHNPKPSLITITLSEYLQTDVQTNLQANLPTNYLH